jgi:hypothetical protein
MTEIVVSKRDGIVTAPDGTKTRVHRGRTLADASHPVVVANPRDWSPMHVDLSVQGSDPVNTAGSEADDLRNELAEVEELAESRGNELRRLADALVERGYAVPKDQQPGWVVDLALTALDASSSSPGPVPAPKAPRPVKRGAGRPALDDD